VADFKQIDEARKLLGLGEDASLEEIKDAYRF
jgi:curved DNA-binding protein CbpA